MTNQRLILSLDEGVIQRLELMMAKTNVLQKSELITAALRLYEWAIDERELGRKIGSIDENGNAYTVKF